MNIDDFKRIVTAFADTEADLDLSNGRLLVQIRDEVIEATVRMHEGDLWVNEDGQEITAYRWIVNRVARVSLLADRILTHIPGQENFVTPSGLLLDQPEFAESDEQQPVGDAAFSIRTILGRRPAGTSTVLYLTSDAGEGKTTLINHVARVQAQAFKNKEHGADWLLVPISLGGRPFLRFDDVVVGALVNRLRFQLFYYEAFLELVKIGVIVPAFDGFEEMFVESSSGEALSALGNLMNSLHSAGSVLIAARKAYFEYQSFATQTRLFDSISDASVSFARLALERWSETQFIQYAEKRYVANPHGLYATVAGRLSPNHPVLTRAVLVRRLLDVATQEVELGDLLGRLGTTPQDYFYQFVNAIIEREAHEKWIDRSGDAARPLISTAEHHLLLSMLAQEMWVSSTDALPADVLDLIADMFSEAQNKTPIVTRQIKERLKQHSLISTGGNNGKSFSFDHEDFREFFLGEALGHTLCCAVRRDVKDFLNGGSLPADTCDAAVQFIRRAADTPIGPVIDILKSVNENEIATSYVRENCGAMLARLLDGLDGGPIELARVFFPADSCLARRFKRIRFVECDFQATSMDGTQLQDVSFIQCRFDRIELRQNTRFSNVEMTECTVLSLVNLDNDERFYDPVVIRQELERLGVQIARDDDRAEDDAARGLDDRAALTERVLRLFMRTTQMNEHVLRLRLGIRVNEFNDHILPVLLEHRILEELRYVGGGRQRRYKLAVPMRSVEEAMRDSGGDFDALVARLGTT